jgi:cholesterol transport system auxiliary component
MQGNRGMMRNRLLKGAPLAVLALGLAGCVSFGGGKVPAQLFGLTAARTAPAGASASGSFADAIVVLDPETDRRLSVQRVPVQVDDATVAYLQDALWVERPARLMRSLLAETIRAKGGRLVLEGMATEPGGKTRLSGRLLDMGYDARSRSVIVRLDALREETGGTVTSRRFESVVPVNTPDAKSVGPALNQAANDVAGQVADWIG